MNRVGWRLLAAIALSASYAWVARGAEPDSVVLASPTNPDTRLIVSGNVLDFTGGELLIELPGGAQRRFPAEQVVEIRGTWTPEQQAAEQLIIGRQYKAAAEKFLAAARANEQRRWVRHRILASLVICELEQGHWDTAGDYFLGLLRDSPASPYFDRIPLVWSNGTPGATTAKARQWLARADSPPAQLLGASHLLATGDRAEAVKALQRLAAERDPRVAQLADAQLWRATFADTSPQRLAEWRDRVEQMPASLRAGPYLALGQALLFHQQTDQALLALLRPPLQFAENRAVAAESLWLAAGAARLSGHEEEASRLFRELATNFADSPRAAEALKQLHPPHSP